MPLGAPHRRRRCSRPRRGTLSLHKIITAGRKLMPMKAVVILGAGASAGFGVPTLRNVFKDKAARDHLAADSFLRQKLENKIWKPRGVDLETSDRSLTVEEILTMIRDAEQQDYGWPRVITPAQAEPFRRALYCLIKKAVYDGKNSRKGILDPLLKYMRRKQFESVTWASFNWDCMFEAAFYYSSGDSGTYRTNPDVVVKLKDWTGYTSKKHKFLKLHGAINWWYENDELVYLRFTPRGSLDAKWNAYQTGAAVGQPVILEPSFYKYSGEIYDLLKGQWQHFVDALAEADLVIVVGYSLPESDSQARAVITLGFQWNRDAQWIVIDESADTCDRYLRIVGDRRLTPLPIKLEDLNPGLEAALDAFIDAG